MKDPAGEYARTLRFLGVDDGFRPDKFRGGPLQLTRRRSAVPAGASRTGCCPKSPPELWPDIEIPLLAELEPDVRELKQARAGPRPLALAELCAPRASAKQSSA